MFHHKHLGGPFEDPVVYIRLLREKRALLFDCGDITSLSPGEMQKITDVFVSHTHMDHFIGFDTLLRALLSRDIPLNIYGPESILECVEGKLRGYTWNLIDNYPFKMEVFALGKKHIRHVSFHAPERFEPRDNGTIPFNGMLMCNGGLTVKAARLDHGITSLAFSLEEDYHININKDAVLRMGLDVGHWLAELKQLIRDGAPDSTRLTAGERIYSFGELRHLASITDGQKISYVSDCAPTQRNEELIADLVRNSHTLYCESYFLHDDIEAAKEKKHLTGEIAGRIARKAGVRQLIPLHSSPRYIDNEWTPAQEAIEEFKRA